VQPMDERVDEDPVVAELSRELKAIALNLNNKASEYAHVHSLAIRQLQSTVTNWQTSATICLFGSCNAGYYRPDSDINLALFLPDQDLEDLVAAKRELSSLSLALSTEQNFKDVTLTSRPSRGVLTRPVLVAKFGDANKTVNVQLCMGDDAARASILRDFLIKQYLAIDTRVKLLYIIVRHWASLRGFGEPEDYSNGLSSLSLLLLVIYFLQDMCCPVLPVLSEENDKYDWMRADLYEYWSKEWSSRAGRFKTRNTDSLGELLLDFLAFVASLNEQKNVIISVRCGRLLKHSHSKADQVDQTEASAGFVIEDPILKWVSLSSILSIRNLAFMVSDAGALRKKLSHGWTFGDACSKIDLHEKICILENRKNRK
jgi:DNA polymerase sigma